MKLSELTEAQFRRYFETRLAENRMRRSGAGYTAKCCFHEDRNPSLSVNTEKGCWKCHAGCGEGGVLEFEMKFSSSDKETALARIAEIVGEQQLALGQKPEAVYSYTDGFGKLLFQVVRYPGKRFTQRQPDGKGGWIWRTADLKMVLYNLPAVITSKNIIVVEGEKDADNLSAAIAGKIAHLAVTTSPRGAGKWLDDFALFVAGKQVLVLPDNDKPGREHAERIAQSCFRYAQGVKVVTLDGLAEHGDVSDFLKTHSIQDILETAKKASWWRQGEQDNSLFMSATQFDEKSADTIDWLLEGLIQRNANGMIISRPKGGKSFIVLDLAIALASGQKWLDFYMPKRVKTALVSREDNAGLTQWRKKKLAASRKLENSDLDGWLYINAKGLKPKIMLDYPEDVARLIGDLKRYGTEFLILDVMRVLHGADENDNTDMEKIIDVLNHIQEQTGASICLIHHDNKREDATLTERARGASAIAGWAEFICGLRVVDEQDWIREFTCELKASIAPDKFHFKIIDTADGGIELARVNYEPPKRGRAKQDANSDVPF
jgi:5S rRNA maturation endonuclease (ribonuclease M5)